MRPIQVAALSLTCLLIGSAIGAAFMNKRIKEARQTIDILSDIHAKSFDGLVVTLGPNANCRISVEAHRSSVGRDWPQISFSSEQVLAIDAAGNELILDFNQRTVRLNGTEQVPKF